MTQRQENVKKIIEQEAPSVNDVLDAAIDYGVGALDEKLRDPETDTRVKIAIIKAFAQLQKYHAQASGKGADVDALRAEIRSQIAQELAQKKLQADLAKLRGIEEAHEAEEAD